MKKKIKFKEGDILEAYISSEWDPEVPRLERAIVECIQGKLFAVSQMTNDWYTLDEFNWTKLN